MRAYLVFPPVWLPEAPFLSTAILTAYLKERGVEVVQRDLNLAFWKHFYEPAQIEGIHGRANDLWGRLQSRSRVPGRVRALLPAVGLSRDRFHHEVSTGIISRNDYRRLIKAASAFATRGRAQEQERDAHAPDPYHDLLYADISLSQYAQNSDELLAIVADDAHNPYRSWLAERALGELREVRPAVLGVSIAATNQVVASFTLARMAKEALPETTVVLGGSWCTQVRDALIRRLDDLDFVDALVQYEGEEPLYQICEAVADGRALDGIVNVATTPEGESTSIGYRASMACLPTPDFEGLPVADYDMERTLTLQASRGCYWDRCTFCSYPLLEPAYKVRPAQRVVDEIERLADRHDAVRFGFADALISPRFARALSEELLDRGLRVRWSAFARFEKSFSGELLALMGESGCDLVSWGLESGSERVLGLIQKQIDLEAASRILEDSHAAGIHNRVLVMYGHPTETLEEVGETLRFVRTNLENVHSISVNYYHPEVGTPIEQLAEQLQIPLERPADQDLAFGYEWPSSLSDREKAWVKEEFQRLSSALARSTATPPAAADPLPDFERFRDQPHTFDIELATTSGADVLYVSGLSPDGDSWRRGAVEIETH